MPTLEEIRAARMAQLVPAPAENGHVELIAPVENKVVQCSSCYTEIKNGVRYLFVARRQVKHRKWQLETGKIFQRYLCEHCFAQTMMFLEKGWE